MVVLVFPEIYLRVDRGKESYDNNSIVVIVNVDVMSEEVRNDHAGHLILNKSPSVCPSEKQTWYIVKRLFCKKCPIQKGVF